jgi:hypothetical protein
VKGLVEGEGPLGRERRMHPVESEKSTTGIASRGYRTERWRVPLSYYREKLDLHQRHCLGHDSEQGAIDEDSLEALGLRRHLRRRES